MRLGIAILIALGGAAVSFLVALAFGLSAREAGTIVGIAGGASVAVAFVGAGALRVARGRSIGVHSVIVTLTSIAAVAAAALADGHTTFATSHRAAALATMLITAGTVGALVSLGFGARVAADRSALVEATRIVAEGGVARVDEEPATQEFADVAHELEAMSLKLEQAQERERMLDRSRRELVAWISHDLRTPLARLRAVVEALEDQIVDDPETIRGYYRTIDAEATRLSVLIDDLFELSRLSSGAVELERESMLVADLVSDVVASASPLATSKDVRLSLEVDERPRVELSVPHIERALGNLLGNAIRHTEAGHEIRLRVTADRDFANVEVHDGCGGIPAEELSRLTGSAPLPGEVEATATRPGLGLIIARGLVEAHGGNLSIANSGPGCCFTIALPRQATGDGILAAGSKR